MSDSILDQPCPKNIICACPRTLNAEPLMYYGSGSNMIVSIFYPPSLLSPTEIVEEVLMTLEQGQDCQSVMGLLHHRFWTHPWRIMMIRVSCL